MARTLSCCVVCSLLTKILIEGRETIAMVTMKGTRDFVLCSRMNEMFLKQNRH